MVVTMHPRPFWAAPMLRARRAAGLTHTQIGAAVGRSANTIFRYEAGLTQPSMSMIVRIAAVLDVDPAIFFDEVER